MVYNSSGIVQYNHPDWLGSARLFSTQTRSAYPGYAYAPFGEGYARDSNGLLEFTADGNVLTANYGSNMGGTLDYFMFRRYSPSQGRRISPDPAGLAAVDPTNPQSWNRYAYVTNNPLALVDPFNSANAQTCTYAHDDLVRIASANCGSAWTQSYSYFDVFGNLTQSGTYSFLPTYDPATNRMNSLGGHTPSYDADGNLTNDFVNNSFSWDADGNAIVISGQAVTYDALDRMVEINNSGTYTQRFYSPTGFLMEIPSLQKKFVPLPGGNEVVYLLGVSGGYYYRHADWLGSSRFATTASRTVYYDGAYSPYGAPYAQTGTADYSFTGMEHQFPNLYDFPAREYEISGRWPSPDPAGLAAVDPTNPQSWNRYAYVTNNPLTYVDPLGLEQVDCPPGTAPGTICVDVPGGGGAGPTPLPPAPPFPGCGLLCAPVSGGSGGGGGGGGGSGNSSGGLLTTIKSAVCSALPSGRTMGASGGLGGIGSVGGGGEVVVNYNSGQVSAFGFGGLQVGWNGGASGSIYTGFVYGLNNSNSNYSGGFTGANGGYGLGGFAASSSGGLTGGASGLAPNGQVKVGGASLGASLIPTPTGGVTATNYTKPLQLGKFWAFGPTDFVLYAARQVCK